MKPFLQKGRKSLAAQNQDKAFARRYTRKAEKKAPPPQSKKPIGRNANEGGAKKAPPTYACQPVGGQMVCNFAGMIPLPPKNLQALQGASAGGLGFLPWGVFCQG